MQRSKGNCYIENILYREHISIARGAAIEGQVFQAQQELVLLKSPQEEKKTKKKEVNKEISNG
jgi:cytoskeletal protein CcmA (bactofilin family)